MGKVFNNAFWTGITLFSFVAFIISVVVWGVVEFTSRDNIFITHNPEVVYDTVYVNVEVIKEVQVECNKPHLEVKKPVVVEEKPVEVQQIAQKDTVN
jgi:hypothetical protein